MSQELAANASLPILGLQNVAGEWVLPSNSTPACFNDVAFPATVDNASWFNTSLASSRARSRQLLRPCMPRLQH
jgi:hypothetical protein